MPKDKETVTMLFPHPVRLAITHDNVVSFREGVQEVPAELADHWYLKSNGVKAYEPAKPLQPLYAPGSTENPDGSDDSKDSSDKGGKKKKS